MKKFRKIFGITTLVVIIGVSMIGCDNGVTGGDDPESLDVTINFTGITMVARCACEHRLC